METQILNASQGLRREYRPRAAKTPDQGLDLELGPKSLEGLAEVMSSSGHKLLELQA